MNTLDRLIEMRCVSLGLIELASGNYNSQDDQQTAYANSLRLEIAQHMTTMALLTIEIDRLQALRSGPVMPGTN